VRGLAVAEGVERGLEVLDGLLGLATSECHLAEAGERSAANGRVRRSLKGDSVDPLGFVEVPEPKLDLGLDEDGSTFIA
jgi:hypothetical protein